MFPTVLPATSVAPTASRVIPVTAGGAVYYINPTSLANVPAPSSAPVPTTFPAVPSTATLLATTPFVNVPQPATTSFTVQDLAQLLASSKRDHLPESNWPSTVGIHFNGTSGSASSRVPSIQRPLPMMRN